MTSILVFLLLNIATSSTFGQKVENDNSVIASCGLYVNDELFAKDYKFSIGGDPERIEFRTGKYRLNRKINEYKSGDSNKAGWDEANADIRVENAISYIRDFSTVIM